MKSRAGLCGVLVWVLFLALADVERLPAQCEDCYECNTNVGGAGSSAECCSGARCQALSEDDRCFQTKNDISDCGTSAPWYQPTFEHCTGSTACASGGGGGGGAGGAGGGGCAYQPGGFCPASCSSCSGSAGGPFWY